MIKALTPFPKVLLHFAKVDPQIHRVLQSLDISDWFENSSSKDHFYNLTRNIIFQQLAGKAASTIFGRFEDLVKDITPDNILEFEDQLFRDVGLSWAKAKYVKDLAAKVNSGEVMLEQIGTLSPEKVIKELTKVKGIGRWTAEMFLLFTLHHEDIFSYLDLGLKNGFSKLYGVSNPSKSDLEQKVSSWAPYRSYGSFALWHYLDNR